MTKTIAITIVTPEATILDERVDEVSFPTTTGQVTILPDHVSFATELASGDIVARVGGELVPIAVVGGMLKIHDNTVMVLADFAEHVASLSDEVVSAAHARAKELERLHENDEIVDSAHFETELERSLTRVKIADKWKGKKYRRLP